MGTTVVYCYDISLDPDAYNYIKAVETADGQALEPTTRKAYDKFIRSCKQDGMLDLIKACCILAGARTLNGALVPLKGTAPTNFNFVGSDYNRKTGLKGDGSNKYLRTATTLNDINIDDFTLFCNITEAQTVSTAGWVSAAQSNETTLYLGSYNAGSADGVSVGLATGRAGLTRTTAVGFHGGRGNSTNYREYYWDGLIRSTNTTSQALITSSANFCIFRAGENVLGQFSNPRMSICGLGKFLDLSLLNNCVTQLMTDINNAF
jgi:hypothetical protein